MEPWVSALESLSRIVQEKLEASFGKSMKKHLYTNVSKTKQDGKSESHKTGPSGLRTRSDQPEFSLLNEKLVPKVFEMSKQLDELRDQIRSLNSLIYQKCPPIST